LTLANGQVQFSGASLAFDNLLGNGEIVFDGLSSTSTISVVAASAPPVTRIIGPAVTVRTGSGGGRLAGPSFVSDGLLLNRGTILAQTPGRSLTLDGIWKNEGILRVTDGSLNLGGKFTLADIGTLQHVGGNVVIAGVLNNSGTNLRLDSSTGSWQMINGTISGGTITGADNARLLPTAFGPNLIENAVVDIDVTIGAGASLTLKNATTFASHRITLLGPSAELIPGSSELGPMEVVMDGSSGSDSISFVGSPLTLAAGFSVRTGTLGGSISLGTFDTLTNRGSISAITPNTLSVTAGTIRNEGQMTAANGGTLKLNTLTGNTGNLTVSSGGMLDLSGNYQLNPALNVPDSTLKLQGTWSNLAPMVANNSTLDFSGTWSNSSSIAATDSTINLRSSPSALGSFSLNRSRLNIFGSISGIGGTSFSSSILDITSGATLTNTNSTLSLSPSSLAIQMHGGTISGGTINGSDGQIHVFSSANTVSAGAMSANIQVDGGASLTISGSAMSSNIAIDPGASLTLSGAWSNTTGILTSTNANVTFNGGATLKLGTIHRTGGTFTIANLDNSNATLDLTTLGDVLLTGRISQGTVVGSDSARLIASGNNSTVGGNITLAAPLIVDPGFALILDSGSRLTFAQGGRVVLNGGSSTTVPTLLTYQTPRQHGWNRRNYF
jgi:putative surface-exposed virulence protein